MIKELNKIKDFLLELDYGELEAPAERDIICGIIDLSRYESNILISLLPDDEEHASESDNDFIDGQGYKLGATVTVLCRGAEQEKLLERISDYCELICTSIDQDCSLNDRFTGSAIGIRKYYIDAGAVENQMTAVEIPLTLLYEHEY